MLPAALGVVMTTSDTSDDRISDDRIGDGAWLFRVFSALTIWSKINGCVSDGAWLFGGDGRARDADDSDDHE